MAEALPRYRRRVIRVARHLFLNARNSTAGSLAVCAARDDLSRTPCVPRVGRQEVGFCPQTETSSSPGFVSIDWKPARRRYSCNSCGVEQTVM